MSDEIKSGYTRVTTPLYHFSQLNMIDPDILTKAAERGTRVHKILDAHIKLKDEPFYEIHNPFMECSGYVNSALSWMEGKRFIANPGRMYCDEHKITGEVDAIYEEEGKLVLVDFKTPARPSKTWGPQLSAYAHLCKKYGMEISRIEAARLKKDGKPCLIYTYDYDFEFYLKCLDLYRFFYKDSDGPSVLDYI